MLPLPEGRQCNQTSRDRKREKGTQLIVFGTADAIGSLVTLEM